MTKTKLTKDCFTSSMWGYRSSNFDAWLPKEQIVAESNIITKILKKPMTFLEMAQEFCGSTDPKELKKYALTLPMIEELIKRQSKGEETVDTKGNYNFFFVKDADDGVSVGCVFRGERDWDPSIDRLGDGFRWRADSRLLVPNLDTSILESSDTASFDEAVKIVKAAGYQVAKII